MLTPKSPPSSRSPSIEVVARSTVARSVRSSAGTSWRDCSKETNGGTKSSSGPVSSTAVAAASPNSSTSQAGARRADIGSDTGDASVSRRPG